MIVLTALLTASPDPQRRKRWVCDPRIVDTLARSVVARGHELIVVHDEPPVTRPRIGEWVRVVAQHPNPYFARWFAYRDTITSAIDGEQVWCVDGSDVELLHDPAPVELACGAEPSTVGTEPWMAQHHPTTALLDPSCRLLNAGILGGPALRVRSLAADIADAANTTDLTDMAVFNLVLADHMPLFDEPVHTVYKAFEHDHPAAWWRHK